MAHPIIEQARINYKITDYRTNLVNLGLGMQSAKKTYLYLKGKWEFIGEVDLKARDRIDQKIPNHVTNYFYKTYSKHSNPIS